MSDQPTIERVKHKLQLVYEVLDSSSNSLNAIDLDFSLAKLIDVYEELRNLKATPLNNRQPNASAAAFNPNPVPESQQATEHEIEEVAAVPKTTPRPAPTPQSTVSIPTPETPPAPKPVSKSQSVMGKIPQQQPVQAAPQPKPTISSASQPEPSIPTPAAPTSTVPKKFQIALNDKFEYIREVFAENKELYTQFMQQVQQVQSFAEVIELSESYQLNKKDEVVQQFLQNLKDAF